MKRPSHSSRLARNPLAESVLKNIERLVGAIVNEPVEPLPGTPLLVNLALAIEHSGICLGGGEVAELHGSGRLRRVSFTAFRDGGDGVARVELDYVTPKYRDFTPGEFVYRQSGLFGRRGFHGAGRDLALPRRIPRVGTSRSSASPGKRGGGGVRAALRGTARRALHGAACGCGGAGAFGRDRP